MRKVLIIGAGGFVGRYLIDELDASGDCQIVATRIASEDFTCDKAEVMVLDIMDRDSISDVLAKVKPDVIFHLAAQSSVAASWKKPLLTVDINIEGTINVLDAVRGSGLRPRVMLIGSAEEYGPVREDENPVSEERALHPSNIYAATKACQGMLGDIYAQAYGMDLVMIRAFNHVGPGQADLFVVSNFCKQVALIEKGEQDPVIHVGNLAAKRDFTDVRDVMRAYRLLADKGVSGETYNVGSGHARSIQSILDVILSRAHRTISVEVDEDRFRPIDVPLIEADVSKLVERTGWSPEHPLEEAIIASLEYWRGVV